MAPSQENITRPPVARPTETNEIVLADVFNYAQKSKIIPKETGSSSFSKLTMNL